MKFPVSDLHEELISEFVSRMRKEKGVEAIFLVGSVARGSHSGRSDVDLYIIADAPKPFESTVKEGIVMEIHRETLSQIEEKIENSPMVLYSLSESKALYDPKGAVKTLKELALAKLREFKVDEKEVFKVKYWLSTTARKIEDSLDRGDYSRAGFYASTVLWKVVEGLYLQNNLPVPPATLAFEKIGELKDKPRSFDDVFLQACSGDLKERCEATLLLIKFVLK